MVLKSSDMPVEVQKDSPWEEQSQTFRATVPDVENLLYKSFPVLDHGFVRLIDYMGDDSAVVQAARVSYGRGTKKKNEDKGLIHYLMRHRHTTPFEMCEVKFHIKLPIFVARQWIRHRTASVNEYSARYSILGKEFYLPKREHHAPQSSTNKQGRGGVLSQEEADRVLFLLENDARQCYDHYEEMLNEENPGYSPDPSRIGLTRELARMNLTLNYYTEWYWKVNLHNLLHFLALRSDHHAQYEIRAYADVMLEIVKAWVPLTFQAFEKYRLGGTQLSVGALQWVRARVQGQTLSPQECGLSAGEMAELKSILGIE